MGRRSQEARAAKRLAGDSPVYPAPPGELIRVFMAYDPGSGEFHRYDVYKSFAGKRKVDVVVDRERVFRGRSVTWLFARLRAKMATLPEICG